MDGRANGVVRREASGSDGVMRCGGKEGRWSDGHMHNEPTAP